MAAGIVQAKEAFNKRQRRLVVTFINGDELCASMGRSAMVPDFKRHISSKYGTPFGLQELFIVGSNIELKLPLSGDCTINDASTEAGLSADAMIYIFMNRRSESNQRHTCSMTIQDFNTSK
jgi:hypothetical protein